ncbi:hypothetical protein [Orenia marismortui]|uniref:Uncharacterized protein n=1 Tax=Orenia marismortui TaxID=46469 RepID=A0A4R8GPD6_9FIRM|nr:hypothetical protein [Orenia marismortui]TDX44321.1 hypothetical protein C7959_1578 [Orenia marismortui]
MFKEKVTITREKKTDTSNTDGGYSYPDPNVDNSDDVIISDYRCNIDENVSYATGDTGQNISGSAKMVGQLVSQETIKEGDKVNNRYKVIGKPKNYRSKTITQLVRLE